VEDGREVFDDDLDDEHVGNSKGTKTRGRKKDSSKSGGPVKTSNIKNMFLNIPSKNKEVSHLFALIWQSILTKRHSFIENYFYRKKPKSKRMTFWAISCKSFIQHLQARLSVQQ
jgi:hypothetical protein